MAIIGLLSDTHGTFDYKLRAFFEGVDEIWHAGDFGNIAVSDVIAATKPLRGVHGNCDGFDLRLAHPLIQLFELEGLKFMIIHIGGYPRRYDERALQLINEHRPDVFICGHSHILKVVNDDTLNMMCINPGAAGSQGFHHVRTAIRFRVEKGALHDMEVGEWKK